MQRRTKIIFRTSLALNLLVAGGMLLAWAFHNPLYRTFLHPRVTAARLAWFEEFPVTKSSIVFLGDSLTQQGSWSEMFPGIETRNRGIGGDQTRDVLARLGEVIRAQPPRILLLIGTNDLAFGVAETKLLKNFSEILERLERESPTTEVVVQGLLPREPVWAPAIGRVNLAMAKRTARGGHAFIDPGRVLAAADGSLRPEMTWDGLHLLAPGYAAWRKVLEPWVRAPLPDLQ